MTIRFYIFTVFAFINSLFAFSFQQKEKDMVDTSNLKSYYVEYQKSFVKSDDFGTTKNIFSKLSNFIFGSETKGLLKPNNIYSIDSNRFIVLDQGLFHPIYFNLSNGDYEILEFKKDSIFPSLVDICKYKENYLLFTDSKLNKIFTINIENNKVNEFKLQFDIKQPTGIVYLADKNEIWITETFNHRICIIDEKGNLKRTIGKRGSSELEFNYPTHLASDKSGDVYVVDAMNFRIQIISNKGEFKIKFGETGDGTGYFSAMKGICLDRNEHIYIVDGSFHNIQVFDKRGNFLYYFGGKGTNPGKFISPNGLYISDDNHIYIADTYNKRIQVFKLIGVRK